MHTLILPDALTRALTRRATDTDSTPAQTAIAILEAALSGDAPVVADLETMLEEAATRLQDGDHIAADIVHASRTGNLETMRAEAVAGGMYLRAFLIDSAIRVYEREQENAEEVEDGDAAAADA